MRISKRLFAFLAAFLMAVILIVLGAAAAFWIHPEILLNEHRLHQALRWAPANIKISWKKLDLKFEPLSWKGKKIYLVTQDLCVAVEGSFDTCINSADIGVSMRFKTFVPKIMQIDRLRLDVAHFTIPPSKEDKPADHSGPLPDLRPPTFASVYPEEFNLELLRDVNIKVNKFTLEKEKAEPMLGTASLQKISSTTVDAFFALKAELKQKPDFDLRVNGDVKILAQVPSLDLKGMVDGSVSGWQGKLPLTLGWSDSIKMNAKPAIKKKKQDYAAPLTLDWTAKLIHVTVGGLASNSIWKQGRLETQQCVIESKLNGAQGYPESSTLQCGVKARPKNRLLPTLDVDLRAKLDLTPESSRRIKAAFTLEEHSADSFFVNRIDAKGGLTLVDGKPTDPSLTLKFSARVPEFQAWKEAWEGTALAIPAPLHVLKGPLEASLVVTEVNEEKLVANFHLDSKLTGTNQSFVTASDAVITVLKPLSDARSVDIDAKALLKDVRLEAPPLRIEEPPQFLPDKRFVTTEQIVKEAKEIQAKKFDPGMPFTWKLKILTEQPIRISTNLLPAQLPITTDLLLTNASSMDGYLEVQPMPVHIFRKQAEVKKFRVSFKPGSSIPELDGRIDHRTPEVLISILILGSSDHPRVEFLSEPPLSREQIISVLLYNKSLTELSEAEASSTQNMNQALSDGALGLFSLLFLSATPIQSIGYDPTTQTYSARVSLGDKTTVSVGSGYTEAGTGGEAGVKQREFGLRRQLGGRWAIRTELRQVQDRPDVVLTLLEWFKRF